MSLLGPESLVGEEISAVAFVRDYVEFHFDGPVLRAFAPPEISLGNGQRLSSSSPGWRDGLCSLIGREVVAFDATASDNLLLSTVGGITVVIPLKSGDQDGPESANLFDSDRSRIWVW